ncbi:MAG TPA: glycosyltransferase [Candidatus Hydrogenedentes bacterium]|nr:glycosyltransferase [Candidatus Hydrogenedentota bacterium]
MSKKEVPVTVLMCVYNAERFLVPAVDSVLSQTFEDFEFLIIDDGSSRRSKEILKRFAALDSRIRLISRENRGFVVSLNEGLQEARGKWIMRLDHDDIATPERLEKQLAYLERHPECVVLGGAFDYIDDKGRLLTTIYPPEDNDTIQQMLLAGHNALCDSTLIFHRDLARQVGGYRLEMILAEDLDLWLRMSEHGQVANLPDVLCQYRLHTRSLSGAHHERQREVMRKACEEAWARRGITGHFEAEEPWRPSPDRSSRLRFDLMYGWWAFNSGERRTAAVYGCRAISTMPWRADGYRLLACALLKRSKANSDRQAST